MCKFTYRSPVTVLLLSIVTCNIYFIYWLYVSADEINAALGREEINKILVILGWFFFPLLLYMMYKYAGAMDELSQRTGVHTTSSFILWFILWLCCGVGTYVMSYQLQQDMNNLNGPTYGNPNGQGQYYQGPNVNPNAGNQNQYYQNPNPSGQPQGTNTNMNQGGGSESGNGQQ